MVEYKSKKHNKILELVDPKYTSQTCSKCGHVDKENRTTQASFECLKCGHKEHADVNAARNILNKSTKRS
jgi:putative transposase